MLQLGAYQTENGATGYMSANGDDIFEFHAKTRRGDFKATLVPSQPTPTGRRAWTMHGHPLGGILTDHSEEHALFEFAEAGDPKPRAIWRLQHPTANAKEAVNDTETVLCQAEVQYHQYPKWRDPLCMKRRQVLRETVTLLSSSLAHFHSCALANLDRWKAEADIDKLSSTKPVIVVEGDWGDVTLLMTKRFGQRFAVLNMANQIFAGGFYLLGEFAQEEDMFRRTDCHFHVTSEECDMGTGRYLPHVQSLISGSTGRVPLDMRSPRVCIRGREDRNSADLGFQWLPESEVFDFYELRSAATDLRNGDPFDAVLTRQKIAAQLDTLIDAGIRHCVLSAFGCGAFRNPPQEVAQAYHDEIKARLGRFDCITFAIIGQNFQPFQIVLASLVEGM